MRTLGPRLYTLSTLVPFGARVADIGTDHGHLPIYLRQSGKCPFVIASDIREKPLMSAKENISKTGTAGVDLRLGAGLDAVNADEVDCITIAGMGGEVISEILRNAPWTKDQRYTLLLQPMTSADALRLFLCQEGYKIESETAVLDSGRIYTVIKARYCGNSFIPSGAFCRIGELNPDDPVALQYIEKQKRIVEKMISDLKTCGKGNPELNCTYNEIVRRIQCR